MKPETQALIDQEAEELFPIMKSGRWFLINRLSDMSEYELYHQSMEQRRNDYITGRSKTIEENDQLRERVRELEERNNWVQASDRLPEIPFELPITISGKVNYVRKISYTYCLKYKGTPCAGSYVLGDGMTKDCWAVVPFGQILRKDFNQIEWLDELPDFITKPTHQ